MSTAGALRHVAFRCRASWLAPRGRAVATGPGASILLIVRRYPALPQPRQLSAYDPEWEEDPQFVAAARKTAMINATAKKLPSPAVLRDILSELTERQRSEERVRANSSCWGNLRSFRVDDVDHRRRALCCLLYRTSLPQLALTCAGNLACATGTGSCRACGEQPHCYASAVNFDIDDVRGRGLPTHCNFVGSTAPRW